MELRFNVDDDYIQNLQDCTDTPRATDLARDGLSILNWAAQEVSRGHRVVSIDSDGHMTAPILDVLNRAQYNGRE